MTILRFWLAMALAVLVAATGFQPLPAIADVAPLAVSRGGSGVGNADQAPWASKTASQTLSGNNTLTGHTTLGLTDITGALAGTTAVFSGNVTALGFVGAGASLTGLNASALASGTVPDARFPATLPTVNGSLLTGLTAGQVAWSSQAPNLFWASSVSGPNAPPAFRALVAADLPGTYVNSFNTRTGDVLLGSSDVNGALGYVAADAANLNASNLTSGTVPAARLPGGSIVNSFNTRTGAVTLAGADVTGALGYTPVNLAGDSMTGALTITVPAQASIAETLATWKVADDSTAKLEVANGASGDSLFIPEFVGTGNGVNTAMALISKGASGTGSNALTVFDARIGSSGAVTTRPLAEWRNAGTAMLSLLPLNSGANATLSYGTQAVGSPSFTTRSGGTRLVFFPLVDGSNVDFGMGVETGGPWISTRAANTTNQINLYGGTSKIASFRGDGMADITGGVYAAGSVFPSGSGPRATVQMNGGNAVFGGYNYLTSAYLPAYLDGSSVALRPSGTAALTASSSAITAAQPLTVTAPAQASAAETVATLGVADDATGKLEVLNQATADANFVPMLRSTSPGNSFGLVMRTIGTTDTGTNAVITFDSRIGATGNVVTRPLASWLDNGTSILQLLPLNSGANGALAFTAVSGTGPPTFGASARSIGSRYVIYPNQASATVDAALGVETGGPWLSTFANNNTSQINFYGGTTKIASFRGDGLFDNTGSIRATGAIAPATGSGAEMHWTGSIARFFGYNRTGGVYTDTAVDGLSVSLRPNASAALTAASSGLIGINTAAPTSGLHILGGGELVDQIAAPAAPSTVTQTGTAGAVSYWYWLVGVDKAGNKTTVSAATSTATANATMSGTNYDVITLAASPASLGLASIDVLRTTSSTAPSGTSTYLVGSVTGTGTTLNDQSNTVTSYAVPTRNATADLTVDGAATLGDTLTVTKLAQTGVAESLATFSVTDSAGSLSLANGTGSNTSFAPSVQGTGSGTLSGLQLSAQGTTDTGTNAVMRFDTNIGGSTNVVTRPMFAWFNNGGTARLIMDAVGALTHNISQATSTAELLEAWKVNDDATGKLEVINGSTTDALFLPMIKGTGNAANIPLFFMASGTTDSGVNPLIGWDARIGASTAVATRPAFEWRNAGTMLAQVVANGLWNYVVKATASTAETLTSWTMADDATGKLELVNGTSADGAFQPRLKGTSAGTNPAMDLVGAVTTDSGTNAAVTIDGRTAAGGALATRPVLNIATNGTNKASFYPSGFADINGAVRSTATSTPASGVGAELSWNGTRSILLSYDRGGSAYKPVALDGSTIELRPNGANMLTATAGGVTVSGSLNVKTGTVTAAGPTTLAATDCFVPWNPTVTAAGTINLFGTPNTGQMIIIKDAKGIASANNLTIAGNGKTIDGAASVTITVNYGSFTLLYNGTEWNVVSKYGALPDFMARVTPSWVTREAMAA